MSPAEGPPASVPAIDVPFEHRGRAGTIRASVRRNEDPERWGYRTEDLGEQIGLAAGFPVCHASVDHPGQGYDRLMGWVQVVWSGPSGGAAGGFDPWAAFDGLDLPYCWFGFAPELFDGPFRGDRTHDLDWEAHSWLCAPPASLIGREVAMLAGFRWGFEIHAGQVLVVGPSPLERIAWNRDLPILWRRCPGWRFIAAEPGS